MARRVVPAEGEWECMNCGYIKAGLADQVPKRCPECGAGADMFAFFDYVEDYFLPKGGPFMAEKMTTSIEGEWECDHCGYVEVGMADKPPEKNCPECGAPASMFVFYPYEYTDEDWEWEEE